MTLAKRIIPCLDVDAGRVVKGVRFRDIRDVGDPAELAVRYEGEGADEVVFLDITASHEERPTTLDVVRRTAERLFVPLTVGGGVRSVPDMRATLNAGADKVAINTAALLDPALITRCSERFGAQCVVVAVDARRVGSAGDDGGGDARPVGGGAGGGKARQVGGGGGGEPNPTTSRADLTAGEDPHWTVYTHGGRRDTGRDAIAWCREAAARGAGEILLTSMDADGTRDGYDLALTRAVAEAVPVPVVASGGCGRAAHMVAALAAGADAALAASIFHDGDASVADVKAELSAAGLPMRPVAPGAPTRAAGGGRA